MCMAAGASLRRQRICDFGLTRFPTLCYQQSRAKTSVSTDANGSCLEQYRFPRNCGFITSAINGFVRAVLARTRTYRPPPDGLMRSVLWQNKVHSTNWIGYDLRECKSHMTWKSAAQLKSRNFRSWSEFWETSPEIRSSRFPS